MDASTTDTPFRASAAVPNNKFKDVSDLKEAVSAEIDGRGKKAGAQYANEIFKDLPFDDATIQKYLEGSKHYDADDEKWKNLPESIGHERELYSHYQSYVEEILSHFGLDTRRIIRTDKKGVDHIELPQSQEAQPSTESHLKSSPDLMIEGRGNPEFPGDDFPDEPMWQHCISPIEGKTNKGLNNVKRNETQIAMYARQCFLQQHNRKFVFCLIVTQTKFQLYQFDRCGYTYSTRYNIHEDAALFVRMILGISWEGEMVGFDTSVFWEGKERYIRVTMPETMDEAAGANEGRSEVGSDSESGPSRRITRSASNKGKTQASQKQVERVFKIRNNAPSFLRRSICGRGTTCWVVEDNGEVYLVKDAWRYVNRDPETIWLDIVREKGCRGVAKMITYEHGALISELRRMSSDDFADDFYDRRWCRIILHAYGHDISHFKGLAQLLGALRDAISGHKELWDAGILHRDISSNNILLGADDAQPGERGILIDFDLAISTFRRDSLAAVDFRTGTRRFQALHLLMVPEDTLPRERGTITESSIYDDINNYDDLSDTEETKENRPSHPAHCHLDDLESFYYVLAWICLTFDGPGKKKAAEGQLPSLREWDDLDRGLAFKAKRDFLSAEFPMEYLSDYFKPLRKLLRILHDLTYTRFRQTRFEATPDKPVATLYQDVDMAYAMLLKAYDVALSKLPPETKLQPPPLAPEQETPPPKSPLSASASRPAPSRAYGGSASIATFSRKRRTGFSDDEETIESVGELAEEQPKHKRPRSSSLVPLPHSDVTQLTHNRNKSA